MFVACVQPVAMRSAVCSFCMLVVDAMSDHMVEAYSSMGLVLALYVESIVSLCLPHLVDERTLSIGSVFGCFGCSVVYVFVVCEFGVEGETYYFWVCVNVKCAVVDLLI